MNGKMKKRLIIVTLLIVAIAVVVLAIVGSGSSAKALSVSDALAGQYTGKRIQVTGLVVDDSYSTTTDGLVFDVADEDDPSQTMHVVYSGAVPSTFGNGVVAISTGTLGEDGTLEAGELLTKCPSKYQSAEGALTVANLLDYGDTIVGQETRVAGYIKEGTLVPAGQDERFTLYSEDAEIGVVFDDALPDSVKEGSSVVVTGALQSDGRFHATEVAEQAIGE